MSVCARAAEKWLCYDRAHQGAQAIEEVKGLVRREVRKQSMNQNKLATKPKIIFHI